MLCGPSFQCPLAAGYSTAEDCGAGAPADSVTAKRPRSADKPRMGFGSSPSPTDTPPAGLEGCRARPGQGKGVRLWLWVSAGPGNTFYTNGPRRSKGLLHRQDAGGAGGTWQEPRPTQTALFTPFLSTPNQGMREVDLYGLLNCLNKSNRTSFSY